MLTFGMFLPAHHPVPWFLTFFLLMCLCTIQGSVRESKQSRWGRTWGLSWEWDPFPMGTGRVCTLGIEPEIAQTNCQQGNGPRASARTNQQPICLWPPPTSIPWVTCKGTGPHYQELHTHLTQLEEDIWWELGEWQGQGCPTTTKETGRSGTLPELPWHWLLAFLLSSKVIWFSCGSH